MIQSLSFISVSGCGLYNDDLIMTLIDTTPPKQILKSGRPSFNEAGFVPAANIHLGFDEEAPLINGTIVSTESMRLYCYTAMEAEIAAHKNRYMVKPGAYAIMVTV